VAIRNVVNVHQCSKTGELKAAIKTYIVWVWVPVAVGVSLLLPELVLRVEANGVSRAAPTGRRKRQGANPTAR
jgi:hypothetical protein